MDLTQVALGLVLIAGAAVTAVSPSVFESNALVSALALGSIVVAGGALLVGVAREDLLGR